MTKTIEPQRQVIKERSKEEEQARVSKYLMQHPQASLADYYADVFVELSLENKK